MFSRHWFDRGRGAEEEAGRRAALVDMTGWGGVSDDKWRAVEGDHTRRAEVVARYFFAPGRFAPLLCVFEY